MLAGEQAAGDEQDAGASQEPRRLDGNAREGRAAIRRPAHEEVRRDPGEHEQRREEVRHRGRGEEESGQRRPHTGRPAGARGEEVEAAGEVGDHEPVHVIPRVRVDVDRVRQEGRVQQHRDADSEERPREQVEEQRTGEEEHDVQDDVRLLGREERVEEVSGQYRRQPRRVVRGAEVVVDEVEVRHQRGVEPRVDRPRLGVDLRVDEPENDERRRRAQADDLGVCLALARRCR